MAQWLFQPWLQLWISNLRLIGPVQSDPCATIWIGPQAEQVVDLCLLQEIFRQRYLPFHHLLMDQANSDPML